MIGYVRCLIELVKFRHLERTLFQSKILLGLLLFAFSYYCEASEFKIEFGLLGKLNKGYFLKKQTNKIPYVTKDQGQIFGAIIEPSDEDRYETYAIFYLPGAPSKLSDDTAPPATGDLANILRSPRYQAKGMTTHAMWLDDGDPAGKYMVEIYINDELAKTIKFDVAKPEE